MVWKSKIHSRTSPYFLAPLLAHQGCRKYVFQIVFDKTATLSYARMCISQICKKRCDGPFDRQTDRWTAFFEDAACIKNIKSHFDPKFWGKMFFLFFFYFFKNILSVFLCPDTSHPFPVYIYIRFPHSFLSIKHFLSEYLHPSSLLTPQCQKFSQRIFSKHTSFHQPSISILTYFYIVIKDKFLFFRDTVW